jgi:predicted RNase H-like HicB family nuclease
MRKKLIKKIYEYAVIPELNDDKGYKATVLMLPGFVTEEKTLEEAKRITEGTVRCYLYGLKKNERENFCKAGRDANAGKIEI